MKICFASYFQCPVMLMCIYFQCVVRCIYYQCVVKWWLLHVLSIATLPQMNGWAKFFWHKWVPFILLETCRTKIPADFFHWQRIQFFCNQYKVGKGGLCIKTELQMTAKLFHSRFEIAFRNLNSTNTVKPCDPKLMVDIDRWSLFKGHLCFKSSKWGLKWCLLLASCGP